MKKFERVLVAPLAALSLFAAVPSMAGQANATPDDAAITANVQAALAADKRLQVREPLEVRTQAGVVQLIGEAKSASMVYRAVETARNVDGVVEVDSHRLDAP